jgi:hypothetical protein
MRVRTFKACLLVTLLATILSGCIHVHSEKKVVEPTPAVVTPPP